MKRPLISVRNLSIGYKAADKHLPIHPNISFELFEGEMVCLIGPNGAGKSTLLKTLCALLPALGGEVLIDCKPLSTLSQQEIATLLSLVLTDGMRVDYMTVREMIALSRFPYKRWFGLSSTADDEVIEQAAAEAGVVHLLEKQINHLSDGERQRSLIAKALAQETPLILLDEPTSHLDLPGRIEIMSLLRSIASRKRKTILISTHDLELSTQLADRILLMKPNNGIVIGSPEDLALGGELSKTFHSPTFSFNPSSGGIVIHHNTYGEVALVPSGNEIVEGWTKAALLRSGFSIAENAPLRVVMNAKKREWTLHTPAQTYLVTSLEELTEKLNQS